MKQISLSILLFLIASTLFSQNREVPFTLDDRDRIMRTEEKVESLRKEMNARFEGIEYRFDAQDRKFDAIDSKFDVMDSKFDGLYWGIGIIITIILFMLGYIIWDRRTALHPVQNKTSDLEDRLSKLEKVAREQARKDPNFAELLKIAGLL